MRGLIFATLLIWSSAAWAEEPTTYLEAGHVAPVAGYLVPRARFDLTLARMRELKAIRAEALAERARGDAIAGQLEQERGRRKDAEEIAAKADRAARGQRKKNWLSWVRGIGLGLIVGGIW